MQNQLLRIARDLCHNKAYFCWFLKQKVNSFVVYLGISFSSLNKYLYSANSSVGISECFQLLQSIRQKTFYLTYFAIQWKILSGSYTKHRKQRLWQKLFCLQGTWHFLKCILNTRSLQGNKWLVQVQCLPACQHSLASWMVFVSGSLVFLPEFGSVLLQDWHHSGITLV